MSPKTGLSLDIYSAAGIIVLGVASTVLVFFMISNWGLVATTGSNMVYYLVAMMVASAAPLAMLSLYILNIRDIGIELRSKGGGVNSDIEIDEKPTTDKQIKDSIAREVETKNAASEDEQKKGSAEQIQLSEERNTSINNPGQINIEDVVREEVAKASAGLISKIDGFSQDVQGIRRELEEIKSAVESTIIDIRGLLSEISNPFNYLRRFTTETDIKELELKIPPGQEEKADKKIEGKGSATSTTRVTQRVGKAAEHSNDKGDNQGSAIEIEEANAEEFSRELVEIFSTGVSVSKLMRIIIFVGDNLQTLGRDGLLSTVELGVSSGVIPRESMDIIAKVLSLIESTKIPPKRLAITLHRLAKSLGITDKEAEFLTMALSEG